ncbi:MAG: carbon monoxide dehydrogenase subunit G [Thaumarchaeota archaeon]|nr:MAG: carbon monoxide dehydrogenase subunit G [Nitrososphaerota archaeon]TMQ01421.1 MAG: carbon monoxide dehydrogenase subunit G [Nitrososphaerota archaeon]
MRGLRVKEGQEVQLHLTGSTTINAKRERVFQLLTDPSFIATTLPDAVEVALLDKESLEAKMKVKVALISSSIKVRLRITDRVPPSSARLLAEGSGSGSNLKIISTFSLEGDGTTTTRLSWVADAEITGLMAGLGSLVLRGFAEKKVGEIFAGITKGIEGAGR